MADRNNKSLYYIVGAIVVVVALLFLFMSGSETGTATTDPAVDASSDAVEQAGEAEPGTTPPVGVETDSPPAVDAPAN